MRWMAASASTACGNEPTSSAPHCRSARSRATAAAWRWCCRCRERRDRVEGEAPLRVLLVDDHALVRSAIRQALDAPDIEVVGEARNAEEALELAPQLRPDLV